MKLALNDLFTEYTVFDVFLPRYIFREIQKDYEYSSVRPKGIIVECLSNLFLRRIYKKDCAWTVNPFSPVDFVVPQTAIDIKSTTRSIYTQHDIPTARKLIEGKNISFYFILISPEEWSEREGRVSLRVHEMIILEPGEKIKRISMSGAYKSFL